VLALGGEERTLRPAPQIRRQLGGALVKCRPGRQTAARPRSPGRAFQLGGDVLVEPGRRLRAVPGPTIGIGFFTDPDGNTWLVQEVTTRLPGR
jgi:hypothetical protein